MLKIKMNAVLLGLFALFAATAMGQTKKSFTLDDLMWGGSNYWNLQPKNIYTAWWGDCLMELDVEEVRTLRNAKGRSESAGPLFTLQAVNSALDTTRWGKVYSLLYTSFPYTDKPQAFLQTSKANFLYDWKQGKVLWTGARVAGSSAQDFCSASKAEAYVKDNDLYVTTAEGKTLRVSTDGSRELVYGQSVHRDEFGISKGTFWSPKGTLLAFYRMDQSMVTDYPLVDINHRVAQLAPEKYPMAGMTSHKVTVGVFNPATGSTVYLQAGDPTDRYFTNIAWSPDEKTVYVIELPRSQDKAELVAYDATTGARKGVLFTEENERYVEPMTPICFTPWNDKTFIYQSRRDGWNHIYLFDTTGRQLAQLTSGEFEVSDVVGFNTRKKTVIFRSNEGHPLRQNYYSVSIKGGKRLCLGRPEGCHNASLSGSGAWLLDRWSAHDVFRRVDLLSTEKNAPSELHRADSPWKDYAVPEISSGSLLANDGKTQLFYRLVKPVDFDPTKKYPAVVYVYGGPHAHNVEDAWNFATRPWEIYMAQKGYVIFVLDNRGSEHRGFDFESITHRRLGEIEMQDQMTGVEYLKSLPYVDADRLGVHGWSFGGFMTTNLMCSYPETFKVGVAGGPVIDWKLYEVMYGERYMDTPDENPEGYDASNLTKKAKNLKGRLQIIVGYNDPTCILQHSLSFLRACEDAGTQPDYFVYPGQGHNMMGRDMVHLHERITRYFEDYLK